MDNDWKNIRTGALQFLFGVALSVGAFALYVASAGFKMETESLLEIAQETLLLLATFFFGLSAWRNRAYAGGLALVAGFTSVCFIRELDACLDRLYHGSWKLVVIIYLLLLFLLVRRLGFRTVIPGLSRFCRSRAFAMMLPGVVIILAYSRLFGMKYLWNLYLPGCSEVGTMKTFSEESVELVGYAIIFGASLVAAHKPSGHRFHRRRPRPPRRDRGR